ncbi:hypothetical protein I5Q34_09625 [Streptomyces sp. AV19]|uniref:hypothetical protein n=1 Tax=Streptomyces sp. AV19 TaxID=2793068 RepID=UPI0018FE9BDF|nr:hypothetical protein [Streptomyces sp. AV19]MBH1934543.1 hypothetical protein [Streptomyces sp. AV19]MDG4530910.1 hypothetical protein [Streptomyces sp. AV19]
MTLPSWQDEKFGSKTRAALWLEAEVGEGNVFTKTRLREAFPDVAQIDRRMRDLRDHGWTIHTRREDPSLKLEEQRYVKKGAEIWLPGQAKVDRSKSSLTAAQRTKVMAADSFLCRSCGIGAGESYGDGGQDSQLDVARRRVLLGGGLEEVQLVTECNRCRVGGRGREVDLVAVIDAWKDLMPLEQRIFAGWVDAGERKLSDLEKLWGVFRSLPESARETVRQAIQDGNE